jgi:ATP adenylyltransferase
MHVVPRWNGDTNFMTTIAETRVLPEDFKDTMKKLKPYFRETRLRNSKEKEKIKKKK